jgi:sugar phosphate isomerase/epimerase
MPKRLSFQLYSARNFQPWEHVLPLLAEYGYKEVEGFGGVYGTPGAFYDLPKRFRDLLDRYQLTMPTGHFNPIELFEKDKKRVLNIARSLGMTHIYCPYIAPEQRPSTAAGWKAFGKRLGEVGKWARDQGLGFGWHNHDFEFVKTKDGVLPIECIFEGGPMLDWECDIGWVIRARHDPVKWFKSYGERITAVHVKDNAPKGENLNQMGQTEIGQGTADWPRIFNALYEHTRCLHYVVEHDDPRTIKTFARDSIAYLKRLDRHMDE